MQCINLKFPNIHLYDCVGTFGPVALNRHWAMLWSTVCRSLCCDMFYLYIYIYVLNFISTVVYCFIGNLAL